MQPCGGTEGEACGLSPWRGREHSASVWATEGLTWGPLIRASVWVVLPSLGQDRFRSAWLPSATNTLCQDCVSRCRRPGCRAPRHLAGADSLIGRQPPCGWAPVGGRLCLSLGTHASAQSSAEVLGLYDVPCHHVRV